MENWSRRSSPTAMADWLREFRDERERRRIRREMMQPIIYRITDSAKPIEYKTKPLRRSSRQRIARAASPYERGRRGEMRRNLPMSKIIQWLQGNQCFICDRPMSGITNARDCASLDHVRPRREEHRLRGNMLIACLHCNNNLKRGRSPKPCELLYLEFINELLWLA